MSDVIRAISMMRGLSGDPEEIKYLVIEGAPPSKARPRFGKGARVHSSKEMRAAEMRTGLCLRQSFREPLEGNVALACVFFRPNRQRIDADNMLKHVCDAANGIVWKDDSQVTAIMAVVEMDAEHPRTLVAVAPHTSSLQRGTDAVYPCAQCGSPISYDGMTHKPKFCSKKCRYEAQESPLLPPKKCLHCGNQFTPNRGGRCRPCWIRSRSSTEA